MSRPLRGGRPFSSVCLHFMKNLLLPAFLLLTLLAMAVSSTSAQPSSGGPTPTPTPTSTPIDGGASLLLAGGVAMGVRYLKRRRAR